MKRFGFLLIAVLIPCVPARADVPVPQVSGPIASPDVPGMPSHNYIFFASNHDLAAHGYVEEEFFIRGTAGTYAFPGKLKDGTPVSTGQPYYTRVVVRRPTDPRQFNGTVLVEWNNATNLFDADQVWFFDWEHIMRAGYAWVGVSAQTVGVAALKTWNPARYGQLDVGKVVGITPTGPGDGPDADAMSYDIFSQVGAALKHPGTTNMLHGLNPKLVIATGESQSAGRLTTYVNSIHPSARIYDGFLLLSAIFGGRVRDDLISPVFKINTEYDVAAGDALARQPDTAKFRSWDVAGTSHVDQHLRASREPLELRDNGRSLEAAMAPLCAVPQVGTRVPTSYVVASAFDKLSVWAAGGRPPPSAPHLDIAQMNPQPQHSVVARDGDGLAQGGIQLSELAVPTQINVGTNKPADPKGGTAGGEAIGPGACLRWGYSLDMTADQLNARYPSHTAYVTAVKRVTDQNVRDGFILPYDATATVRAAEESRIGH